MSENVGRLATRLVFDLGVIEIKWRIYRRWWMEVKAADNINNTRMVLLQFIGVDKF